MRRLLPFVASIAVACIEPSSKAALVAAPFEPGSMVPQIHYGYHARGTELVGRRATYGAVVSARGELRVTPATAKAGAPAVRIETIAISRGGAAIDGAGSAELAADGSVSVFRAGVLERLRNWEDGVEQSWTFLAPPEGAGDLVVRVRVDGLATRGDSERGHHFGDASGSGVCYGPAMWIDGQGRAVAVASTVEDGAVVMRVPEAVVEASAFPAVLDPVVSPEIAIDAPVAGAAFGNQVSPAVASNGTSWLVTWADTRALTGSTDLWAARVALGDGGLRVEDPSGVRIGAIATSVPPSVPQSAGRLGAGWLVAWKYGDASTGYGIRAARLGADAQPLDATPIDLGGIATASGISVACADACIVAWVNPSSQAVAVQIAANGTRGSTVVLASSVSGGYVSAASDGVGYVVATTRGASNSVLVSTVVLSGAGAVLGVNDVATASGSGWIPSLAWGNGAYALAWAETTALGSTLKAVTLDTAGRPRGAAPATLDLGPGTAAELATFFDQTEFQLVWPGVSDGRQLPLRGARLALDGTFTAPAVQLGALDAATALPLGITAAPAAGTGFLAFRATSSAALSAAAYDVRGIRIAGGAVLDAAPVTVSQAARAELGPAVAWNGSSYLVAWKDTSGGTDRSIKAVRVSQSGEVLDPSPLLLSTTGMVGTGSDSSSSNPYPYEDASPAVASDGTRFLVVWSDARKSPRGTSGVGSIYGRFVSAAGEVSGPDAFPISPTATSTSDACFRPRVSYGGGKYLVAWERQSDAMAQLVGPSGEMPALPITLVGGIGTRKWVATAFDGMAYVVLWKVPNGTTVQLVARRLQPDGMMLPGSIVMQGIAPDDRYPVLPSVSCGGGRCVVVWTAQRPDGTGGKWAVFGRSWDVGGPLPSDDERADIMFAWTGPSGAVNDLRNAMVAYDGQAFVVAWKHKRSVDDFATVEAATLAPTSATPSQLGELFRFGNASPDNDLGVPALASDGAGGALLAYDRFDPLPPFGTGRVRMRTLSTWKDTTPPVISGVPAPVTAEATSASGAAVSFAAPSATDLAEGPVPVTCVPASGATFPLGTTAVTCTAADASGNQATASFSITVVDTTPPAVTATGDVSSEATGPSGATVTYASPSATDLVSPNVAAGCTPASGTTFPVGATVVTCTAHDGAGNVGAATFTVRVVDTTAPVFAAIANLDVEASEPAGAPVGYAPPVAADLVSGAVAAICTPSPGSTFPLGRTTVTCTATDPAGNAASATFAVTVADTTAPAIAASGPLVAEATGPLGATVLYAVPPALDVVDGAVLATCTPLSGSLFPLGTTAVRCTATDRAGNTSSSSFTVDVVDRTPPSFGPAPDRSAEATGAAGAAVSFAVGATDLVTSPVAVTCTPASGSTFPLGATPVACRASDAAGNVASVTFTVRVADTTPPAMVTAALVAEATGPGGAVVAFDPAATDLVSGAVPATCAPGSGSTFPLGTTVVRCSAVDSAGNVGGASFTVTVHDTTPPVVGSHRDLSADATGPGGAAVTYEAPAATDLVSGPVPVTCTPASGSTFPLGGTAVSCTAVDGAGNQGSTSFTVSVVDRLPPAISTPAAMRAEATGPGGATVLFAVAAVDLVDGAIPVTCTPASGSRFPLGATSVACGASDLIGNAAAASFTVTVVDTTPPTLSAPAGVRAEATGPGGAVVTFTADAVDLVDGARTPTCTPRSGSTFALGTTAVVCTVADAAGNRASASFAVAVLDTTAPTIGAHPDVVAEATGPAGAAVTFAAPAGSDLVSGPVAVACAPASGRTFPLGTTAVTCSAQDAAGNVASASFRVTVRDTTPPVIVTPAGGVAGTTAAAAPSGVVAEATGPGGAAVAYVATASDLVSGAVPVTCTPASGSTFPLGTTDVSCSAQDLAGNRASASFLVAVRDTTPPALAVPASVSAAPTRADGGAVVTFTATATDLVSGAVVPACTPASGSVFPAGRTTVSCTATDAAGNSATASFGVTVAAGLEWSGLLRPVRADGSSVFKLGRTVPLRFRLTGRSARRHVDARAYVAPAPGGVLGPEEPATSRGSHAGNWFRWNPSERLYVFNLSTEDMSEGTWAVIVNLGDGVRRATIVSLRD